MISLATMLCLSMVCGCLVSRNHNFFGKKVINSSDGYLGDDESSPGVSALHTDIPSSSFATCSNWLFQPQQRKGRETAPQANENNSPMDPTFLTFRRQLADTGAGSEQNYIHFYSSQFTNLDTFSDIEGPLSPPSTIPSCDQQNYSSPILRSQPVYANPLHNRHIRHQQFLSPEQVSTIPNYQAHAKMPSFSRSLPHSVGNKSRAEGTAEPESSTMLVPVPNCHTTYGNVGVRQRDGGVGNEDEPKFKEKAKVLGETVMEPCTLRAPCTKQWKTVHRIREKTILDASQPVLCPVPVVTPADACKINTREPKTPQPRLRANSDVKTIRHVVASDISNTEAIDASNSLHPRVFPLTTIAHHKPEQVYRVPKVYVLPEFSYCVSAAEELLQ